MTLQRMVTMGAEKGDHEFDHERGEKGDHECREWCL